MGSQSLRLGGQPPSLHGHPLVSSVNEHGKVQYLTQMMTKTVRAYLPQAQWKHRADDGFYQRQSSTITHLANDHVETSCVVKPWIIDVVTDASCSQF